MKRFRIDGRVGGSFYLLISYACGLRLCIFGFVRGVEGGERECRMGGWGLKLGGEGEQGEAAGGE